MLWHSLWLEKSRLRNYASSRWTLEPADVEQEPHDQEDDLVRRRCDAELCAEDRDAQQDDHTLRESSDEQRHPGPGVAAPVRSEHDGQEQDA